MSIGLRHGAVTLVAALALAGAAGAAAPQETAASPRARLVERALGETPMPADLEELCDRIGGRPTGTAACRRAVDWAVSRFRDAGLTTVGTEPFTVPAAWLPGPESASCVSPETFPLHVAAAAYSAPTPTGSPLVAPLVDAGTGTPEEIERLGNLAAGAIGLVRTPEMTSIEDLFGEYMRDRSMLAAAHKAGLAGLLLMSTRPRGLLYRHPVTLDGRPAPIPIAVVAREEAGRLLRLMASGTVRVSLDLQDRVGGSYQASNVIAEIRGREKPKEVVLVGAHLDSWDLGTGAQDNGVNVATIIDIARGMSRLGLTPKRTVRFALFTGEEQGMWGSAGYVARHAGELDDHVAVIIADIGSGRITGFFLNGRPGLGPAVDEAMAAPPLENLGPFHNPDEGIDGTDNFDFLLSGVPNLVADQDPEPYLPDYHAASDAYDKVDMPQAKRNEAILSALVWSLADAAQRPASRQSREEVGKLLHDTGLDTQMKAFGQWQAWAEGRRGEAQR